MEGNATVYDVVTEGQPQVKKPQVFHMQVTWKKKSPRLSFGCEYNFFLSSFPPMLFCMNLKVAPGPTVREI